MCRTTEKAGTFMAGRQVANTILARAKTIVSMAFPLLCPQVISTSLTRRLPVRTDHIENSNVPQTLSITTAHPQASMNEYRSIVAHPHQVRKIPMTTPVPSNHDRS